MDAPESLTNQLLVSMPGHPDTSFAHSVALICEHSHDRGALGIVVNKPLTMKLGEVMSQMRLTPQSEAVSERIVLRGGPLHQDRGFVLHRPGGAWDSSHKISESIQVTTSRDVLAAMSRGEGPDRRVRRAGLCRLGSRPARARDQGQRLADAALQRAPALRHAVRRALDPPPGA